MSSDHDPIRLGILTAEQPLRKREVAEGRLSSNPNVKYFSALNDITAADVWGLGEVLTTLIDNPNACPTTAKLSVAGARMLSEGKAFRRKFKADPSTGYNAPHVEAAPSQVLLVDLDGITVEDNMWRDDLAAFARDTVCQLLPPRFHNVTCWASLSASAGIKRSRDKYVVGLHVVFVTDRSLDGEQRKALVELDAPMPSKVSGKLDSSTLRCTQMYFTARPQFLKSDPAPLRAAMVAGKSDFVVVDAGLEAQLKRDGANISKHLKAGRRPSLRTSGYQGKMNLLGDGDGLGGFHEIIRDAIFTVVAVHDGDLDWDVLKDDVRIRVRAAPRAASRSASDIDRYTSDDYLNHSISGAVQRVISEHFAPRAFNIPTGTIDVARKNLARGIKRFKDCIGSDDPSDVGQIDLKGREVAPPFVMGIETPTGSGKTRAAVELAVQLLSAGKRPLISAPNHALCNEIAELLRESGVAAEVYRGFSADDPGGSVDEEGKPMLMCRDDRATMTLRKAGVRLNEICTPCPHRSSCGYRSQMQKRKTADIWVIPHALLAHQRPKHTIGPCDILIVDEDPIDAFLTGYGSKDDCIDAERLRSSARSGPPALRKDRKTLASMIDNGLVEPQNFYDAGNVKRSVLKQADELKKSMPSDRAGRLQHATQIIQLLFEAAVWGAIGQTGIGIRINASKDGYNKLHLFRRRDVTKDWTCPTLLLDATPEWDAYRQFWDVAEICAISCDMPHATTRQVKFSASASKFDDSKTGHNNIGRLQRYIEARSADRRRVLVVGQKRLVNELKGRGLPAHVEMAHFNALRGLDRWGDVELLIVIGRTEPPPAAMEIAAEVLFQEHVVRLGTGAYYTRTPLGLNTRTDGEQTKAVMATSHPDPRVELLRKRAVQNEIMQAIGRGRGANRSEHNPLQIDIINEVPLPIAIDEVVSWANAQPSDVDVIYGRHGIMIEAVNARGASDLIRAFLPEAAASRTTQYRKARSDSSLFQTPRENYNKAFETVRPSHQPGHIIRAGSRYSVPVYYQHGVWRKVLPNEEVPKRGKQGHLGGYTFVLQPFNLDETQIPSLYLC